MNGIGLQTHHLDIGVDLNRDEFYRNPQIVNYNIESFKIALTSVSLIGFVVFGLYVLLQEQGAIEFLKDNFYQILFISIPHIILVSSVHIFPLYAYTKAVLIVSSFLGFVALVNFFVAQLSISWLLYLTSYYYLSVIIASPIIPLKYSIVGSHIAWFWVNVQLLSIHVNVNELIIFNAQFYTLGTAAIIISYRHQKNSYETFKMMCYFQRLSSLDSLTGILNHGGWHQQLVKEFSKATREDLKISVVVMDIDHFKKVNDQYGHPTGDEVICTVAKICESNIRDGDSAGRLGGEEFGLILSNTSIEEASAISDRILNQLREYQFSSAGKAFGVTVSIGVGQYEPEIGDADELFKSVDDALYHAKENGRNQIVLAR